MTPTVLEPCLSIRHLNPTIWAPFDDSTTTISNILWYSFTFEDNQRFELSSVSHCSKNNCHAVLLVTLENWDSFATYLSHRWSLSAHIAVSSIFPMPSGWSSCLTFCFKQNSTKLDAFIEKSAGSRCPVVILRLITKSNLLRNGSTHPREALKSGILARLCL